MSRRWGGCAAAGLVAGLVVAATFVRLRNVALIGLDTYPMILTSRILSLDDAIGTVTERLMDGRYPVGEFYRPVVNLSLAVDQRLHGLNAWGYHLTDALWFGACGLALYGLVRRLGSGLVPALVAMVGLLLHPLAIEVVPTPARRPELVCASLLLLALVVQLGSGPQTRPSARPSAWRWLGVAVLSWLAMGAKETALLAPAFGFGLGWAVAGRESADTSLVERGLTATLGRRLSSGARFAAPHLAALLGMLLVRFAVLGGLGGNPNSGQHLGSGAWSAARLMARHLLAPQPAMATTLAIGLGVVAMIGLIVCWLSRRGAGEQVATRLGLVSLTCFVVTTTAIAGAGQMRPWYLFLSVVGWGLLLAAGAQLALTPGPRVTIARISCGLLATLLVWHAGYSLPIRDYPQLERGSVASRRFLRDLDATLERTNSGQVVAAPALPYFSPAQPDEPAAAGVFLLTQRSVQAWAELAHPERSVRVVSPQELRTSQPQPSATTVVLTGFDPAFVPTTVQLAADSGR